MKRFYFKVRVADTGCHLWTGSCDKRSGYGQFTFDGKVWKAHRFAWLLEKGDIPEGMNVLHSCDNPPCVNVEHLFLGTQADNIADMIAKGRNNIGERNARAVFSEADIAVIRSGHLSQYELCERYGVTNGCISKIINYKTWRHLP